jgi:transcriptional regulator with XRE-family HTH domain
MNMTRKQISDQAAIGMTTLYKFETGHITDISLTTLIKLMRSVGLYDAWEQFLPELPESPYLYDDNFKKRQRIRNSKK